MKKNYLVVLVLILLVAVVGYSAYRDYMKVVPLRIATANVPDSQFFFAVLKDKKFDLKNKLNLEIVLASPGDVERKVIEREDGVEVGPMNVISLAELNTQGKDLRIVAPFFFSNLDLIVKKNASYKTLGDLKGKRIATRPKISAGYKTLATAVAAAGLNLENDFKLVFASIPDSIKFLASGDVDATTLTAAVSVPLLASGNFRSIIDLSEEWQKLSGAPMPFVEWAAHKDWVDANPRKVARLRQTILETAVFIHGNSKIIRDYPDILKFKSDAEWGLAQKIIPSNYTTVWNPSAYKFLVQKALEFGFIKAPPKEEVFVP